MSRCLFSVLLPATTSILLFQFASNTIAQQPIPPVRQAMDVLNGDSCDRATELTYQSRQLQSPSGNTTVHFEGTLLKIVNNPSQVISESGFCHASRTQTLSNDMIVANQGSAQRFSENPYTDGYLVETPLSFSPDERYIAAEIAIVYSGLHISNAIAAFDTTTGEIIRTPNICEDAAASDMDSVGYVGFLSATEMVVECQFAGRRSPIPNRFEVVTLPSGSIRTLEGLPHNTASYGTSVSEFEITQVQRF
ncbi:MAG: hypothetical protein ACFB0D_24540 [Phormidesmis sp.]